ncbi:MAG: uroporphyrinogen-III synthase [Rikenellaceae bacterium]|nr:uroporphyrinogen-III synthase [Rikenellaceae bacterium]
MKIKTLLVSQPAPAIIERSPYWELIQKYGVKVDFTPFIKVEGISLKEFRAQRVEILDHPTVLFTSRTTIDHFFRICEEARITIPESMKYLCQTETVALYLQKYIVYRKRKIFFANGSFPSFMELILKHRDENMLLTLSEPHNADLSSAMERLKIRFNRVVLSRAVARDLSGVDPSAYDLMVFYAPAEITALAAAFPADKLPMVATFGGGTARATAEAGITLSAMAPTPEAPSMTKALDLFIAKVNAGEDVAPVVLSQGSKVEDFVKAQEAKPSKKSRSKKPAAKKPAAKPAAKPAGKSATPAKPAAKSASAAKK